MKHSFHLRALAILPLAALAACPRPSSDASPGAGSASPAASPRASPAASPRASPDALPAASPAALPSASGPAPSPAPSSSAGQGGGAAGGCDDLGSHPASSLPPLPPLGPELKGALRGVDTSTPAAWKQLRDGGARFAMVQALFGRQVAASFPDNWSMARRCGVPRGAYHFLTPLADGAGQARAFLELLGDDRGELPPSVDVELPPGCKGPCCEVSCEGWQTAVAAWLAVVEKTTGQKAMVYTVEDFWKQCLCNTSRFALRPLWLAGYPRFDFPPRPGFGGWQKWAIYQHKGNVRFGAGVVDLDVGAPGPEGLARLLPTP